MYRRLITLAALLLISSTANAKPWLFVSLLREKKLVTFQRDLVSGQLTKRHETECPAEPAFLNTARNDSILLVSFRSTGQLASYRINDDGSLTQLSIVEGGADPAYIVADRTEKFLISAYYIASKVTVHRFHKDGTIGPLVQTAPTAEKAHGVAIDKANRAVFIPHTGANRIYQFLFDAKTGRLSAAKPAYISTPSEQHPRHLQLDAQSRYAYVSNEAGDSIGVYKVDATNARLTPIQTATSIPANFDKAANATARCELSPNGKFAYVANRGHDSIACYRINQESGKVVLLGQMPTEKTPRSFTITSDSKFLYAAGQGSGKIAAFKIEPDGRLKRFATYESGPVSWWALATD